MKLTDQEIEILKLIEENPNLEPEDIGKMLLMDTENVQETIERLEESNVILKYSAVIDWSKVDQLPKITAMIDVKVSPKRGVGFDEVAERIYRFPEVRALYLMSGAYDLSIVIEGKGMAEIANFVSEKLSTIDNVLSTTTHFMLKKYKHDGVIFGGDRDQDKRMVVSP
jgi:DNA-binding Lrp family transcriptional regulator